MYIYIYFSSTVKCISQFDAYVIIMQICKPSIYVSACSAAILREFIIDFNLFIYDWLNDEKWDLYISSTVLFYNLNICFENVL